jgi:glycosyltransferase involved in cell wall biosynthesis
LKVLLVSDEYPFSIPPQSGGGGSHVFYLAYGLADQGAEVLILANSGASKAGSPFEDNPRVEVIPCNFGPPGSNFPAEAIATANEACKLHKPHIVHGHHLKGGIVALAVAGTHKRPMVLTMHNPPNLANQDFSVSSPIYQRSAFHNLWHLLSGHADIKAHVAYSKVHKKDLQENGVPDDKIEFVYHGVPVQLLQRKAGRLARPKRFRIHPQDTVILCPLRPEKPGVEVFIRAADLVRRRLGKQHHLRFIVTGDRKSGPRWRQLIAADHYSVVKRRGNALRSLMTFNTFTLRQMWALFNRAQVCVVPSWREGLGIAVLEAMALKIPVVAAEVPGINEVIEDGVSGLLFRPGYDHELAEKIETLLSDHELADKLTTNALERVTREFSAERMASMHVSLYKRLIGEAGDS